MSSFTKADISALEHALTEIYPDALSIKDFTCYLYICGLKDKAIKHQESAQYRLSANLLNKAFNVLSELETRLQHQRNQAAQQLSFIEEEHEASFDDAKATYDSQAFPALNSLFKRLENNNNKRYFEALMSEIGGVDAQNSAGLTPQLALNSAALSTKRRELQSFKQYQSMFEQMALERLLARVMKEIPQNAGPLNPERLVIRSFQALQAISPDYLSRLISYYESLLTLQLLNATDK